VTFRLHDSLPKRVLDSILGERDDIVARAKQQERSLTAAELNRLDILTAAKVEKYLDSGAGACYMRDPAVAHVVASALKHFDGHRYRLDAWCVMPNHVHVLFRSHPNFTLASIVQSWKSFSSKAANSLLARSGTFWQREYYDRLVRTPKEYKRVVKYILDNPTKAKLNDWTWVWCGRDAHTTAGETPAVQD
jgi:REP element-mobilizing transposase RayT